MQYVANKSKDDLKRRLLNAGAIIPAANRPYKAKLGGPDPFRHNESKEYCDICLSCNKPNCKGSSKCAEKRRKKLLLEKEREA